MRYLTLIFIIFSACKFKSKPAESPYFEGMVEFGININSDDRDLDSIYRTYLGNYCIVYIKDSFISRVYCNDIDVIISREIFRPDSMKLYTINEGSDTMYVHDLSHNFSFKNIDVKEAGSKEIMDKDCLRVVMNNEVREKFFSEPYQQSTTYYFDTATLLSPRIHGNIKYGDYYKIFAKYHYLTLGYETVTQSGVNFSAYARRIMKGKVDHLYFDVPKNKVHINPYTSL